jgi:prepilin-type N-terminal cleavage/methylation domain-containing protein/prepilin-type processing-associated H-X9-DG protein
MMKRQPRRRAFTLIEVMTAILIVVLLAAILIPAVIKVKRSAAAVKCLSNMKQIYAAFAMYANDNNDAIVPVGYHGPGGTPGNVSEPLVESYATILTLAPGHTYLEAPNANNVAAHDWEPGDSIYRCPSVDAGQMRYWAQESQWFRRVPQAAPVAYVVRTSYGINGTAGGTNNEASRFPARVVPIVTNANPTGITELRGLSTVPTPSTFVLLFEGVGYPGSTAPESTFQINAPHGRQSSNPADRAGQCNILFFDGHSEAIALSDLPLEADIEDMAATPPQAVGYAGSPPDVNKPRNTRWRIDVQPGG